MTGIPESDKETKRFWPVTFADVGEAQLKAALAMTPAQRLAMAEELLEFARLAKVARAQAAEKPANVYARHQGRRSLQPRPGLA